MHLDLDFLPRSLVYDYDDGLIASSKEMEKIIEEL